MNDLSRVDRAYIVLHGILSCNPGAFGSAWDLSVCSGYPEWICKIVWNEVKD